MVGAGAHNTSAPWSTSPFNARGELLGRPDASRSPCTTNRGTPVPMSSPRGCGWDGLADAAGTPGRRPRPRLPPARCGTRPARRCSGHRPPAGGPRPRLPRRSGGRAEVGAGDGGPLPATRFGCSTSATARLPMLRPWPPAADRGRRCHHRHRGRAPPSPGRDCRFHPGRPASPTGVSINAGMARSRPAEYVRRRVRAGLASDDPFAADCPAEHPDRQTDRCERQDQLADLLMSRRTTTTRSARAGSRAVEQVGDAPQQEIRLKNQPISAARSERPGAGRGPQRPFPAAAADECGADDPAPVANVPASAAGKPKTIRSTT